MAGKSHKEIRHGDQQMISEIQSRDNRLACNLTWLSLNSRTLLKVDATNKVSLRYVQSTGTPEPLAQSACLRHA